MISKQAKKEVQSKIRKRRNRITMSTGQLFFSWGNGIDPYVAWNRQRRTGLVASDLQARVHIENGDDFALSETNLDPDPVKLAQSKKSRRKQKLKRLLEAHV